MQQPPNKEITTTGSESQTSNNNNNNNNNNNTVQPRQMLTNKKYSLAELKSYQFSECDFINCSFSGEKKATFIFENCNFKDCKIKHIGPTSDSNIPSEVSLHFINCHFIDTEISKLNLIGLAFETCHIKQEKTDATKKPSISRIKMQNFSMYDCTVHCFFHFYGLSFPNKEDRLFIQNSTFEDELTFFDGSYQVTLDNCRLKHTPFPSDIGQIKFKGACYFENIVPFHYTLKNKRHFSFEEADIVISPELMEKKPVLVANLTALIQFQKGKITLPETQSSSKKESSLDGSRKRAEQRQKSSDSDSSGITNKNSSTPMLNRKRQRSDKTEGSAQKPNTSSHDFVSLQSTPNPSMTIYPNSTASMINQLSPPISTLQPHPAPSSNSRSPLPSSPGAHPLQTYQNRQELQQTSQYHYSLSNQLSQLVRSQRQQQPSLASNNNKSDDNDANQAVGSAPKSI